MTRLTALLTALLFVATLFVARADAALYDFVWWTECVSSQLDGTSLEPTVRRQTGRALASLDSTDTLRLEGRFAAAVNAFASSMSQVMLPNPCRFTAATADYRRLGPQAFEPDAFTFAGGTGVAGGDYVRMRGAGVRLTGLGVAFTNVADGVTVGGTAPLTMTLDGLPADIPRVFRLSIDGTEVFVSAPGTLRTVTYSWDTSRAAAGAHTLQVDVQTVAGVSIATGVVNVRTAASAPSQIVVSFPSLTAGQAVAASVRVTITAAGTSGTANRFYISVDGVQRDFWIVSSTSINWWWNTGALAAGSHTLSVRVVDAGGRSGTGSITVRK